MPNKKQLFCFTYAGGTASFFDNLKIDLHNFDVIVFEYAGHGKRHNEPFYKNFDELSDDLLQQFLDIYKGDNFCFLGYSMGCISLISVLEKLIQFKFKLPSHVFLSAYEPSNNSALLKVECDRIDDYVKNITIGFGAVPPQLIYNKAFWRTYLPVFRNDYLMIAKYDFCRLKLKTEIPASVFYSEEDTPFNKIKKWSNIFCGECNFYSFNGTHFFIRNSHLEMAKIISSRF